MKGKLALLAWLSIMASCQNMPTGQQKSDSGVEKASVQIKTDPQGHTAEQVNIMERLKRDNEIGSVKHLYVISSYSGDVLEYSTVKGKVTSGNKRLSPKTVEGATNVALTGIRYNDVYIGDQRYITNEVLDDGGAYGESGNYLFWLDAQGNYHQYYPSGGTYLHIADRPLRVRKANFSLEMIQ